MQGFRLSLRYFGEHVLKQQEKGHHVFLIIDTQGAMQLRKIDFPAVYIFFSPPSLEELKERLVQRKTESIESIEKRLSWAKKEMNDLRIRLPHRQ